MSHTSSHGGDTGSNIIIQVYGNTAEMGTDFAEGGDVGLTHAHVPLSKIAWGDSTLSKRVTETQPLPVKLYGTTGPIGVTWDNTSDVTEIANFNYNNDHGSYPRDLIYLAVAGSTSGPSNDGSGGRVGTSGPVWGVPGATAIAITGDVRLMDSYSITINGATAGRAGLSQVEWDQGTSGGFGIPVNVTGGRRLWCGTEQVSRNVDSVLVTGSVDISGGRALAAGTDSIKVYGYDGEVAVRTILHKDEGATAGFSGDALKVAITNTDANLTINVSSTHGVTNDIKTVDAEAADGALKVQGVSGGAPLVIRGDNSGAVEITATSALNTSVSGTVTIDDSNITNSLESNSKPLIQTLDTIKTNVAPVSSIRNDLTSGNIRVRVTETVRPNTVISGFQNSTSSAAQLASNKSVYSGVNIKSHPNNTANIMVGGSDLIRNSDAGYPLEPGEAIFIECDNLSKVYIRSDGKTSGTIHYIGS